MSWWLLPFLMALLIGGLCPICGTLLLVQGRLLQCNLIAHAVLPGVVAAVALGLSPGLGGVASGLGGALLAERLVGRSDRHRDAVLNTTMAGFLGLGVLLIPLLGVRVELEGLLFGDLLLVSPSDLAWGGAALALLLALLARRYQALVYVGVDPVGAAASGIKVQRLQLALSLVTAVVVVTTMTAVGVILVVALMGAPALLTLRGAPSLRVAMVRGAALGMVVSGGGFLLALPLNLPPGPLIGVLCIVLLFPPFRRI